jgi:hypothetical protein
MALVATVQNVHWESTTQKLTSLNVYQLLQALLVTQREKSCWIHAVQAMCPLSILAREPSVHLGRNQLVAWALGSAAFVQQASTTCNMV